MKTYLVTGGAGFIGSNFVLYMLEKYKDITIVNVDKLTYAGNLENLKDIEGDKRHLFVQGDICDEALVSKLFSECSDSMILILSSTLRLRAMWTAASRTPRSSSRRTWRAQ